MRQGRKESLIAAKDKLALFYAIRDDGIYQIPLNIPDWIEDQLLNYDETCWISLIEYVEESLDV